MSLLATPIPANCCSRWEAAGVICSVTLMATLVPSLCCMLRKMLIFVLYESSLFIDPYFIVEETDSNGWVTCPRPTVHKCSAETQTQICLILDSPNWRESRPLGGPSSPQGQVETPRVNATNCPFSYLIIQIWAELCVRQPQGPGEAV